MQVTLLLAPGELPLYTRPTLPPLPVGVITGYLRAHGVEVEPYDLNIDLPHLSLRKQELQPFYDKNAVLDFLDGGASEFFDLFCAAILTGKDIRACDAVGISCGADFSWLEIHSAFVLGKYIQRHYGKPVVLGGNNITYLLLFKDAFRELWLRVLRNFPFVITGPGETSFYMILQQLQEGNTQPTSGLHGQVYLQGDEIVACPESQPQVIKPDFRGLDLDQYLNHGQATRDPHETNGNADLGRQIQLFKWPPHLSLYANQVYGQRPGDAVVRTLVIPYLFNYNCPYNCAFCSQSAEKRRRVILGNVEQVVDDIATLMDEYGANYFYFFNNAFNYSKRFVREFHRLVMQRGLKFYWSDCARFNTIDFELLKMMHEAGCRKLVFGLETASPKVLQQIDKRLTTLAYVEQVLKWCHELGIWTDLEMIVGLPNEYDEDFAETCRFIQRNRPYINYMNLNAYFIVPDSLLGRHPERYGIEILKDPRSYERMLAANYRWLAGDLDLTHQPRNMHVYKFDERDGRNHQQLAQATKQRIATMNQLQNREFGEVWRLLTLLDPHYAKQSAKEAMSQ